MIDRESKKLLAGRTLMVAGASLLISYGGQEFFARESLQARATEAEYSESYTEEDTQPAYDETDNRSLEEMPDEEEYEDDFSDTSETETEPVESSAQVPSPETVNSWKIALEKFSKTYSKTAGMFPLTLLDDVKGIGALASSIADMLVSRYPKNIENFSSSITSLLQLQTKATVPTDDTDALESILSRQRETLHKLKEALDTGLEYPQKHKGGFKKQQPPKMLFEEVEFQHGKRTQEENLASESIDDTSSYGSSTSSEYREGEYTPSEETPSEYEYSTTYHEDEIFHTFQHELSTEINDEEPYSEIKEDEKITFPSEDEKHKLPGVVTRKTKASVSIDTQEEQDKEKMKHDEEIAHLRNFLSLIQKCSANNAERILEDIFFSDLPTFISDQDFPTLLTESSGEEIDLETVIKAYSIHILFRRVIPASIPDFKSMDTLLIRTQALLPTKYQAGDNNILNSDIETAVGKLREQFGASMQNIKIDNLRRFKESVSASVANFTSQFLKTYPEKLPELWESLSLLYFLIQDELTSNLSPLLEAKAEKHRDAGTKHNAYTYQTFTTDISPLLDEGGKLKEVVEKLLKFAPALEHFLGLALLAENQTFYLNALEYVQKALFSRNEQFIYSKEMRELQRLRTIAYAVAYMLSLAGKSYLIPVFSKSNPWAGLYMSKDKELLGITTIQTKDLPSGDRYQDGNNPFLNFLPIKNTQGKKPEMIFLIKVRFVTDGTFMLEEKSYNFSTFSLETETEGYLWDKRSFTKGVRYTTLQAATLPPGATEVTAPSISTRIFEKALGEVQETKPAGSRSPSVLQRAKFLFSKGTKLADRPKTVTIPNKQIKPGGQPQQAKPSLGHLNTVKEENKEAQVPAPKTPKPKTSSKKQTTLKTSTKPVPKPEEEKIEPQGLESVDKVIELSSTDRKTIKTLIADTLEKVVVGGNYGYLNVPTKKRLKKIRKELEKKLKSERKNFF